MALFKDVKKSVVKRAAPGEGVSALRPRFVEKTAPCVERCPSGTDVRGWLTTIAQAGTRGRSSGEAYEAAWRTIVETNPFPSTLARICPHPCEKACNRSAKDQPVAINVLEGFVGDLAIQNGLALTRATADVRAEKVAVIGAGPAGLSCAYQLARRGYRPSVFEASERPGGRLRDAIRTGRLPEAVLDAEVARIVALGVEVTCGMRIDETDRRALRAECRAVFVATGRRQGAPASEGQGDEPVTPVRGAADLNVGDEGAGLGGADEGIFFGGDVVRQALVAAAISEGRVAAVAIDAWLSGRPVAVAATPPSIRPERMKLGWYKAMPRHEWAAIPPVDVAVTGDESWRALEAEIDAEAARCLSCGLCMDCDNCWMYCTSSGFERLPKGQHYRIKLERCNGCKKCGDECPSGYIDLV
jgi:Pyruvate/2-oxoacid:ferredoxin oxidoreductase delta subunit